MICRYGSSRFAWLQALQISCSQCLLKILEARNTLIIIIVMVEKDFDDLDLETFGLLCQHLEAKIIPIVVPMDGLYMPISWVKSEVRSVISA